MQQDEVSIAEAGVRLQNLSLAQDEPGPQGGDTAATEDPSAYEETHVHSVYESIADHFSATRYSPWPLVASFLGAQPAGSVGLDVGCGNGKYLSGPSRRPAAAAAPAAPEIPAAPYLFILGSDRSAGLAKLAREKHAKGRHGADVLLADSLALPFRDQCADFVICIAVVHHLSTRERRQAAVKELLRCVRPRQGAATAKTATAAAPFLSSGSVLLYVWALEQASSRRGWAAGGAQDLLVPWVKTMKDKTDKTKTEPAEQKAGGAAKKKQRKQKTGSEEPQQPPQPPGPQAEEPPAQEPAPKDAQPKKEPFVPPTFHRYYHLYREGELEEDVGRAGGRVVASGYERDNWWVIADVV